MARALIALALLGAMGSPAVAARHRTVCVAVTIELIPFLVCPAGQAPLIIPDPGDRLWTSRPSAKPCSSPARGDA